MSRNFVMVSRAPRHTRVYTRRDLVVTNEVSDVRIYILNRLRAEFLLLNGIDLPEDLGSLVLVYRNVDGDYYLFSMELYTMANINEDEQVNELRIREFSDKAAARLLVNHFLLGKTQTEE